eukprot:8852488-Alexandrium_andersonii.AAC.1
MFDPMGRTYHKVMYNRGQKTSARPWAAGYAKGKRREMAITQQLCLGARLRRATVGHAYGGPGHEGAMLVSR